MKKNMKIVYFMLCFAFFSLALSDPGIKGDILRRGLYAIMLVASGTYAADEIKNKIKK